MKKCFVLMSVLIVVNSAKATVSFQGLGDLPGGDFFSQAHDISADGSVIVGVSNSASNIRSFRWKSGVMNSLGGGTWSGAHGISGDGSVVTGTYSSGAYRWTQAGGMIGMGDALSEGFGISSDGSVVVGDAYDAHGFRSRRWEGGVEIQPCSDESTAFDASADGTVVVGVAGYILSGVTVGQGFRWTESGGVTYPYPAAAHGVSDDGSAVAGEGFYWTESGGIQTLDGTAYGISADGLVLVGESSGSASIWDDTNGMRDIKNILENGGLDLSGWTLSRAMAIAVDGLTIVGYGTNPDGYTEGWVATVPEPATLSLMALGGLALLRRRK